MKNWQIIGVLIFLIMGTVLMSGCISPRSTTATPKATPTPLLPPVTNPTVSAIHTVVSSSINIESRGNSGWIQYTNFEDHFSIYKPSDWQVIALDKSEVYGGSGIDTSQFMNKVVYAYTPNMKGFVMIYGIDLSGTITSAFNNPGKTQISDELYDSFIEGIKLGETDQIKITSFVKDSNQYLINGNPARHVSVYSQMSGENLNGDFYLIAHENAYYIAGYFASSGSSQSDSTTATNIMQTFTTTI